jgi:serine protease Do
MNDNLNSNNSSTPRRFFSPQNNNQYVSEHVNQSQGLYNTHNDESKNSQKIASQTTNSTQGETSTEKQVDDKKKIETVKVEKRSSGMLLGFLMGVILFLLLIGGIIGGLYYNGNLNSDTFNSIINGNSTTETKEVIREISNVRVINEDSAVTEVVENSDESVVSVVITQDLNRVQDLFNESDNRPGAGQTRVGAGTGFIISREGYIITNRHVVDQENADYTVVFSDGTSFSAEVLDRDTILDIAVLKIEPEDKELKPLALGESDSIKVGQTAIAIGNSLGEFSNSVSKGVISGLGRTITASDGNGQNAEVLDNIIQTDASINPGNSGGPLLDIQGNVIGVNVARADADNVSFAIPIDDVKVIVESVVENGEIRRPFLGIRYREITPEFAAQNDLNVEGGVLIIGAENEPGISPNSAADKAGLQENDIILKINDQRLDEDNSLRGLIQRNRVGDTITLDVLRDGEEIKINAVLEDVPEN